MDRKHKHPFGFEAIMRESHTGQFRRWYAATSRLPPPGAARTTH